MTDPVLDRFKDLDYPGKRKPVLRQQAPVEEAPSWDAKPRTYKVKGVDTEFFTVLHLALAVNRTARTVRYWESKGIIPAATFRAPRPHKGSVVKEVGDRLYTRDQIEAIVKVAREEGVLAGKAPSQDFTRKVTSLWLHQQHTASSTQSQQKRDST